MSSCSPCNVEASVSPVTHQEKANARNGGKDHPFSEENFLGRGRI